MNRPPGCAWICVLASPAVFAFTDATSNRGGACGVDAVSAGMAMAPRSETSGVIRVNLAFRS